MTGPSAHYGEELQDLLDGRLAEPRRSEIAAHVEACERCRRELDALRWIKTEMPRQLGDAESPPELMARVRASLEASDSADRRRFAARMPRRAWIGAALAAAAAVVLVARGRKSSPLPRMVAADFDAYESGALQLDFTSDDPQEIEARFARNGIAFPTRVFDLGMMQYRLQGGRVHELDGRTSALFAYSGPGETALLCQMYEGRVSELPATADVREHGGIPFQVHRSGNLTLVFWQEGDVVCVLASRAPTETVVQLAFAKAVRVEATPTRG
jgi:anti-sigma factor RsiW